MDAPGIHCLNLTLLQSEAETQLCVCVCVGCVELHVRTDIWVCVEDYVACTFKQHACVFGIEVAARCQAASSTLRLSHIRVSVPIVDTGKT